MGTKERMEPGVGEGERGAGSKERGGEVSEYEFCLRFKARMIEIAGEHFHDGESVAGYADDVAPSYFETDWQRAMGPEECADADISYWGEE